MTLTGTIATWVIAAIIFAAFIYGLYHIYCNFFRGESTCCKESSSSSCGCCCGCHTAKQPEKKDIHKLANQ